MTAETTPALSVDAIDAALAAASLHLSEEEQRLAVAVYRLLSAGDPVGVPAVAAAAGIPEPQAASTLRSWPEVFWDSSDRVTGFWGLTAADMPPHRIRHAGVDLSAWCAFDPLFLARAIGDLEVTTADPVTGEAITYRVGRDGAVDAASHPGAVLSFRLTDQTWGDDVRAVFCHYVRHFTSRGHAEQWTAAHPGTFVISLDDATELARRFAARRFGSTAA